MSSFPSSPTSSPVKILVAGCSYAGIKIVLELLESCQPEAARRPETLPDRILKSPVALRGVPIDIHIVDERDGYLHLIGCPLAFASKQYAAKAWTRFEDIPALQHPSIRWTQGSIVTIDPARLVAQLKPHNANNIVEHSYDYFVAATGLRRCNPTVPNSLTRSSYLSETNEHIEKVKTVIARDDSVVIVGGGAVGIEMAAELKLVQPSAKVILVHSRSKLLSSEPFPDAYRDEVLKAVQDMGVDVILGHGRVQKNSTVIPRDNQPVGAASQRIILEDGIEIYGAGLVIDAVSKPEPSTAYLPESCKDSEGLVKINNLFHFLPDHANDRRHLAIGDIAVWPGVKRAGMALHMGYLAADNIHQQILYERQGITPDFLPLNADIPPVMGLAVGKKAANYSPQLGVQCSEELMRTGFGDDLSLRGNWDYLKLSVPWKLDI